jgi:teichuronic acid biosynthesis glycosyltransferase TuaG
MDEKISVIIPTYNRFKYLLNAIESIKTQTYKNIEILVVNDKSTQKEYYEYQDTDSRVKMIHLEKNSRDIFGYACVGHVRNQGILYSTGKYIAFCDDDSWFPKKLETQMRLLKKTGCKMSSTNGLMGSGGFNKKAMYRLFFHRALPERFTKEMIKNDNTIVCSSVLLSKEIVEMVGCFKTIPMRSYEDLDCWIRVLEHTECVYVNEPLVYYDSNHGDGKNY